MDIRNCSATTPKYFQETIESRINSELLKDLEKLAIPPSGFEGVKESIKELVTLSEGWMFNELPFKVQVHPCFSKLHIEFIGSTSEGLSIGEVSEGCENEELDLTAILQTITATESEQAEDGRTWLHMQYCEENPGFVRLKVQMNDNTDSWCGLCNVVSNQDGTVNEFYLSPKAFTDEFFLMFCLRCSVENFHYSAYCKGSDQLLDDGTKVDEEDDFQKKRPHQTFFIVTQEGPAVKTTSMIADSDLSVQFDCSLAIKCPNWPSVANEFKDRKRISSFPSTEFVKRLTSMGCLIVPKYPQNSLTLLEWRLSFCLIERELMLHLTETQRRCYLLFKAIWRQFLCPPIGKALQSYHLKNAFLWECEHVALRDWTNENTVARVMGLLQRLQYNLFTRTCPHYILPGNNLFKDIDHSLLFYAGMRVQTAIFQSQVVWIENDMLLYLPPHKCRTSLGKRLRSTCLSALKYVIEAIVSSAVKGLNKEEGTVPRYEFDSETIKSLEAELKQSFSEEMAETISRYIQSSLVYDPDNITRTYICSRADPKQLLVSSKSGLLDGISAIANVMMNWGNIMDVITSLEVLETEKLKEYGYSEEYKGIEKLKLFLRMNMDNFGRYCTPSFGDNFDDFEDGSFVCDDCENGIAQERYHCKTCPDFDVCKKCYPITKHPHEFELIEMDDDDEEDDADDNYDDDDDSNIDCNQS